MRLLLRSVALSLLLLLPGMAEEEAAYTTAEQARLPAPLVAQLAKLKQAGISEVLVPTWLPEDLGPARGEVKADAGKEPQIEIVWPSSKNELRSLVFRGVDVGPDGPGPDSVVAVENPVLGDLEMMVYSNTRAANRYSTDFSLRVPREKGVDYCLDLQTIGNSPIGLSSPEMQKILGSVRKLKL